MIQKRRRKRPFSSFTKTPEVPVEAIARTDISHLCDQLTNGECFVIKHDLVRRQITLHIIPPGRPEVEMSGFLHNFPTADDPEAIRAILDGRLVKLHEIVGIELDTLVVEIMNSRPVRQN